MALLIAAALVVFVIFWDSPPDVFINSDQAPPPSLPRATSYMINSKTSSFNEQGANAFILETEQGQFFEHQNKFVMDKPIVKANHGVPGAQAWQLTANSGVIFDRGKRIELNGSVHAWQYVSSGLTELRTPRLTYFPNQNLANTDHKVSIKTPGSRIRGVGMRADFERQTLQLLSKVKSTHNAVN